MWLQLFNQFAIMNLSGNPSKRPRLDDGLSDGDQNVFDLWDEGELTAEEFDLLEIQATQKVKQNTSTGSRSDKDKTKNMSILDDEDEVKKQQYALEGKIKLLSDSLDETVRDLNMERLNREQLILQKTEELRNSKQELEKEIEKMQTVLQFKDQEMKVSQNKIHMLEQKFKEILRDSTEHSSDSTCKRSPSKFLSRFQFAKTDVTTKESFAQTTEASTDADKNKLKLISPGGELNTHDIVSSFLLNRRHKIFSGQHNLCHSSSVEPPFIAFARLNVGHMTNELLQYFDNMLGQHVSFLSRLSSISHGKSSQSVKKLKLFSPDRNQELPPELQQVSLGDEIELQHATVTSCLKDLHHICSPFESQMFSANVQERNEQVFRYFAEPDLTACSNPLFTDEEKIDTSSQSPACLHSLILLAKPDTYPECYKYKTDELQLTLSVFIEWSLQKHISLNPVIYTIPFHVLVSGSCGSRCAHLSLKLLSNLAPLKNFESLTHQHDNCLLASVANLCQSLSNTVGDEYAEIVSSIENFLGEILAVLDISVINEENCSCSTQLAQGYIIMLWRYHHMCCNTSSSSFSCLDVLKRGVILLHQLFNKMKDFREKRLPVEDQYITLICGISKLSKINSQFKNLLDIIHDLWDFQDYISDEHEEHNSD